MKSFQLHCHHSFGSTMPLLLAPRNMFEFHMRLDPAPAAYQAKQKIRNYHELNPRRGGGLDRFTNHEFCRIAFDGDIIKDLAHLEIFEMELMREVTYSYTAGIEADITNANKFIGQAAERAIVGGVYGIDKFIEAIQATWQARGHDELNVEVAGYIYLVMMDALADADRCDREE